MGGYLWLGLSNITVDYQNSDQVLNGKHSVAMLQDLFATFAVNRSVLAMVGLDLKYPVSSFLHTQ